MAQKPKLLHSHIIASSRLFTVESMDLEFSNGEQRTYERLVPGGAGAVMMVAINANQEVMLIKEYGAGIEDYTVTLPKGAVDLGESLIEAANRELKEEIGFGAREITHLKQMSLSPSYMKSGIDVMVAWDLFPEQLEGDEPEPLEVLTWPLADIESLVTRSDFTEGRAIAALLMARDWFLKQAI